jgi:hypothetical protein
LERDLGQIDPYLTVDRAKRHVYCPLCPGKLEAGLPQVLDAHDGVLNRCRGHTQSGVHQTALHQKEKQRTLDGALTRASTNDR